MKRNTDVLIGASLLLHTLDKAFMPYHVNPSTGEPSVCRARHRCPFGDLTNDHYATRAEAMQAFEMKQISSFADSLPVRGGAHLPYYDEMCQVMDTLIGEQLGNDSTYEGLYGDIDLLKKVSGDILEYQILEAMEQYDVPLVRYKGTNDFPDFEIDGSRIELKSSFNGGFILKSYRRFFELLTDDFSVIDVDYLCVDKGLTLDDALTTRIVIQGYDFKKIWELAGSVAGDKLALTGKAKQIVAKPNSIAGTKEKFLKLLFAKVREENEFNAREYEAQVKKIRRRYAAYYGEPLSLRA